MTRRKRIGKGTVQQKKNGKWWVVVDFPKRADGSRDLRWLGPHPTEEVAERERIRISAELSQGRVPTGDQEQLASQINGWLERHGREIEDTTLDSYERQLRNHVVPSLGSVTLRRLEREPELIDQLYARLLTSGRRDGKGGLSPRTVRYIHEMLRACLAEAVHHGKIVTNPAERATPPALSKTKSTKSQVVWTPAETMYFLGRAFAEGERDAVLWHVLAHAGLRRGEGLGAQWRHINWEVGTLAITQQVTTVNHRIVVKPRTKGGKPKVIHLDPDTMTLLREHQKSQTRVRGQLRVVAAADLVFSEPDGSPLHPDAVSKVFDRRVRRWDMPHLTIHGLRHTMATTALRGGVHPKIVQERLGHSSSGVTLDLYSHVVEGLQEEAAQTIADLFRNAR